ncbi:MAG: hypothetical protein ACPHER_01825 [Nevskiales bacterium]
MGWRRERFKHHADEAIRISVPDDIEVGEILGNGARSMGYAGELNGHKVAIKFYRPKFIEKFRRKYGVDIAQFEFDRNAAFRAVPELEQHTVEPLRVLRPEDGYSTAFVQEFVQGQPLVQLMRELGHLPADILDMGRKIIDTACAAGLHDLDMNDSNIMVQKRETGWHLLVYDFNLMPQYLHAPNPIVALQYKLGIRKKSGRDYQCLERWAFLGEHGGYDP